MALQSPTIALEAPVSLASLYDKQSPGASAFTTPRISHPPTMFTPRQSFSHNETPASIDSPSTPLFDGRMSLETPCTPQEEVFMDRNGNRHSMFFSPENSPKSLPVEEAESSSPLRSPIVLQKRSSMLFRKKELPKLPSKPLPKLPKEKVKKIRTMEETLGLSDDEQPVEHFRRWGAPAFLTKLSNESMVALPSLKRTISQEFRRKPSVKRKTSTTESSLRKQISLPSLNIKKDTRFIPTRPPPSPKESATLSPTFFNPRTPGAPHYIYRRPSHDSFMSAKSTQSQPSEVSFDLWCLIVDITSVDNETKFLTSFEHFLDCTFDTIKLDSESLLV